MSTKTIQIDVIADPIITHVSNNKGGYDILEIAFKDQGKVSGKKLVNFTNQELFTQVATFVAGDRLEVQMAKEHGSDGREFWNWKQVNKIDKDAPAIQEQRPGATPISQAAPKPGGRVVGNNYETPEERALRRAFEEKKQGLIIRQSSISNAIEYLKASNGAIESVNDVLETAELFERFVVGQVSAKASAAAQPAASGKRGRPAKVIISADETDADLPF